MIRVSAIGFVLSACLAFANPTSANSTFANSAFANSALANTDPADAHRLNEAAQRFMNSLDTSQRKRLVYPLKTDARATWSNLPVLLVPPAGLMLADLNDTQRSHVHTMLQLSMSSQGYMKAHAIMWLDDVLRDIEFGNIENGTNDTPVARVMAADRSSAHYAVAVFGAPGKQPWGWKLTGHHLAVNVTVVEERITLTPGFYGSNPRVITQGPYAGFAPLAQERQLGLAMMAALNDAQRKRAVVSNERPEDVIEGPGRRGSLKTFSGLPAKDLNSDQLSMLQQLVLEYLRNGRAGYVGAHLDAIAEAGWDNVWFSWRGPVDGSAEFYYRVHGPRLLIEYNLQNPGHDHAVVRDPVNDYGEDWLGHHYTEHHPSLEDALKTLREAANALSESAP